MGALVTAAEVIRDETTPGANTATRVGEAMVNQAQAIEDMGQTKVWDALLVQESTSAPEVTAQLKNAVGAVVITREAEGHYRFSNSAFNDNCGIIATSRGGFRVFSLAAAAGAIDVFVFDSNGAAIDGNDFALKIEVYP